MSAETTITVVDLELLIPTTVGDLGSAYIPVTNPDPDLELTRDLPAPVLYWQPTQLPSYFHVHLDLVMTKQDLYLLTLFLWILFSD